MIGYVIVVHRFNEDNTPKKPQVIRKVFMKWEAAVNEKETIFEKENYECGIQILPMDIIQ